MAYRTRTIFRPETWVSDLSKRPKKTTIKFQHSTPKTDRHANAPSESSRGRPLPDQQPNAGNASGDAAPLLRRVLFERHGQAPRQDARALYERRIPRSASLRERGSGAMACETVRVLTIQSKRKHKRDSLPLRGWPAHRARNRAANASDATRSAAARRLTCRRVRELCSILEGLQRCPHHIIIALAFVRRRTLAAHHQNVGGMQWLGVRTAGHERSLL